MSKKLLKKSVCFVAIVAQTLTVYLIRLVFSLLVASHTKLFQQFLTRYG